MLAATFNHQSLFTPLDGADELVSPERAREREERVKRRALLREARRPLQELPCDEWFEIPGRWAGGRAGGRAGRRHRAAQHWPAAAGSEAARGAQRGGRLALHAELAWRMQSPRMRPARLGMLAGGAPALGACAAGVSGVQPQSLSPPSLPRLRCRPGVVWELKDYSQPTPDQGRARARNDAPFLFKVPGGAAAAGREQP